VSRFLIKLFINCLFWVIGFNDPAKNRTWVSSKSTMRSTIRLRDLFLELLFLFFIVFVSYLVT
jgi:hypothetical protein